MSVKWGDKTMQSSRNHNLIPTDRRNAERARRVGLIIHALSDRFTSEVLPSQSSHFQPPEPEYRELVIGEEVEHRDGRMILKVYPDVR